MRFQGKSAVITGSARGLGAATAIRLAREGADIVVNDLSADAAEATAAEIRKLGRTAIVSAHDVSDMAQARAMAEEAKKAFGKIDVLVNNAGITRDAMFHKMTEEHWDQVVRVNLKGVFCATQACVPAMIERKYGKILNLSSIAWLGNLGQTNYSATKAGVVGMTRTLAIELARHSINVNAIAPGFFDTQMTQAIPAEVKEKFIARIPMKRMGKPEEIASLISFLVSDEAAYVTGQVLQIDGGLTVGVGGI